MTILNSPKYKKKKLKQTNASSAPLIQYRLRPVKAVRMEYSPLCHISFLELRRLGPCNAIKERIWQYYVRNAVSTGHLTLL